MESLQRAAKAVKPTLTVAEIGACSCSAFLHDLVLMTCKGEHQSIKTETGCRRTFDAGWLYRVSTSNMNCLKAKP
eukprot:4816158-Amphidinium_carterae.1